jgi:hypothetical protein
MFDRKADISHSETPLEHFNRVVVREMIGILRKLEVEKISLA